MGLETVIRIYTAFKREGTVGFLKLLWIRFKKIILQVMMSPIAFPITICILAISPWIHIRLIKLHSNRIGHYSFNTEIFLSVQDKYQSEDNRTNKTLFYTVAGYPICNKQMHRMWKRVITILPFPYLADEVNRYLIMLAGNKYEKDLLKKYFELDDGIDKWALAVKIKKCHTYFTLPEEKKGKKLMEKIGIPADAKYICLLGRDPAYLKKHMPNADFSYHDLRNVNLDNYKMAARFLAENGYYVVRMGKHVESTFDVDHSKVIDYANCPLRSDFMDVYLSARCFFFLSVGSGVDGIAQIFRRPVVVTNQPILAHSAFSDWSVISSKKIFDIKKGRNLTFDEICIEFLDISTREWPRIAHEKGLQFVENSPEDIKDVAEEMLKRLTGDWKYSEDDELLQRKFWKKIPRRFTNEIPVLNIPVFEYKNMMEEGNLRVGANFLRKIDQ